jgi:hypothetical protein
MDWKATLLVFIVGILTECAYTGYAHYCAKADTTKAPLFAGLIAVGKGILVVNYVRSPVQIATLAIAQVMGTYLTLSVIRRH